MDVNPGLGSGQKFIPRLGFKMETAEDAWAVLEVGEWATSLDLFPCSDIQEVQEISQV